MWTQFVIHNAELNAEQATLKWLYQSKGYVAKNRIFRKKFRGIFDQN